MNVRSAVVVQSSSSILWLRLGVLLGLILVTMVALRHVTAAKPDAVRTHDFTVSRAMQDVARIAAAPHPLGTDAHAAVRDQLLERLRALGLDPQVQSGTVVAAEQRTLGKAENIVARLPGTAPGKAVLLVAHYDSVPGAPGAADNGASVAAILETLRVLKSGPLLRNDVMVLFSDGEEAGMLGARLFARQHPWARNVGVVFNFDYRGNAGPVWMFQTSERNGRLIREWQSALPEGQGSSLMSEVYRAMPNDTDFTVLKALGPGLNFAAAEHYNSYHTALDSANALDMSTLQQQGDILVALTRHFGAIPLDKLAADNVVYFDVPGLGLVQYGTGFAVGAGMLVVALFAATISLALRRFGVRVARLGLATLVVLLSSALLAALCQLAWFGLRMVHPGYQLSVHGSTYNGGWYLAAFGVLSATAFIVLLRVLRRRFELMELTLAGLVGPVTLMVMSLVVAPGGSFVFTWPVLAAVTALLATQLLPALARSEQANTLLALVAALPAVLLFVPLIHLLYVALTPELLLVTIIAATLLYGITSPLLLGLGSHRGLVHAGWVAVAALLTGGAWTSGFDAHHPQPENLLYAQSADSGEAWLVSEDKELDAWARGRFGPEAKRAELKSVFGPSAPPMWAKPMQALFDKGPVIDVRGDHVEGAQRVLELDLRSGRQAPRLQVSVDGATVQQANVQGEPYTRSETAKWRVNAYAMGSEPVQIVLRIKAGTPFAVRVRDISYGLPAALGSRPEGLVPQAFGSGDTLQVAKVIRFN
jgi:hypothetical protein